MNVFIDKIFDKYYKMSPLTLVDAGASGGLKRNWRAAEKYLQVIAFEPDKNALRALTDSGEQRRLYFDSALYSTKTSADLYITRGQVASSLLKPNREFLDKFPEADRFDIIDTVRVDTDTLDNQLAENKVGGVDFIKIDTQGSELSILEGATETLSKSVFGIEVEVSFEERYKNQPLFSDIDNFLRPFGFQLFDLNLLNWKRSAGRQYGGRKGQLIMADALYFKDSEHFSTIFARVALQQTTSKFFFRIHRTSPTNDRKDFTAKNVGK